VASRNFFYKRLTVAAGASFPDLSQFDFGFQASKVIVAVVRAQSNNGVVAFSFKGGNVVDGELFAADGPIAFDGLSEGYLWAKSTTNVDVRVWAWRG
jgi:hypothetical protein